MAIFFLSAHAITLCACLEKQLGKIFLKVKMKILENHPKNKDIFLVVSLLTKWGWNVALWLWQTEKKFCPNNLYFIGRASVGYKWGGRKKGHIICWVLSSLVWTLSCRQVSNNLLKMSLLAWKEFHLIFFFSLV